MCGTVLRKFKLATDYCLYVMLYRMLTSTLDRVVLVIPRLRYLKLRYRVLYNFKNSFKIMSMFKN